MVPASTKAQPGQDRAVAASFAGSLPGAGSVSTIVSRRAIPAITPCYDALVAWATGAHPSMKTARQCRQPDGLPQWEIEVLGLLARGLSNPQIAQALFITRKTVEHHHLEHIDTKLGLSCRTAAVAYAVQHRLA